MSELPPLSFSKLFSDSIPQLWLFILIIKQKGTDKKDFLSVFLFVAIIVTVESRVCTQAYLLILTMQGVSSMQRRQKIYIWTLISLTAIHLLFANFYQRIYAYMNTANHLNTFLVSSILIRGLLLIAIVLAGFTCIRYFKNYLPIYLGLFLINFLLFFFL
ncbi:hypothetical protein HMPREF9088_0455 [Enterococcus italicus DSM 15952]|uniref:Uncharacterized protein n=2 Tax=Enterococcus italicus TaxID=246144 RepID=E6LDL5_ENTI1|nr:hypothetical protein HMPREF9088_0455 [Enterococcus italicus DSM 15952]